MESLLDLGMSLPSTVGHNDHEMPPKHGQTCDYEGALLTESWPLPAASTKIKSWALKDADLQYPLERSSGWRQKTRHSVLWEKPGKTGLQIVRCFQVKIFMSLNSCIFSYLEKHNVTNHCLDLVLLASPSAAFLRLLIFGPYIFNFLVKSVSSSSSMTRISPSQHPDNARTSCLILLWTLISLCGNVPRGPQASFPWDLIWETTPQW